MFLIFDKSNGNFYKQRYVWVFKTREQAIEFKKDHMYKKDIENQNLSDLSKVFEGLENIPKNDHRFEEYIPKPTILLEMPKGKKFSKNGIYTVWFENYEQFKSYRKQNKVLLSCNPPLKIKFL